MPNKESGDKLHPIIRDIQPNNEIKILKSKLPSIALLGVTQPLTKDVIVKRILSQNVVVRDLVEEGSHLSVVYTKAPVNENPYHQVVLRVDPAIRRGIKKIGDIIYMGKQLHRVRDRFYIRRCNTCQGYGHHQDKCPTPQTPICGYCSANHKSNDCPIKADPPRSYSCHNCKSKDLASSGHSTFWHHCPSYKEMQKKLERTIDYDYNLN